ncbi:MAG: N-acetyl-gamma-glutamyl-phosphate reductase [Rickettsiales bacterium]|nr:N-acetyl-gamma-glutamyl-phosphate reductase [Rickettsiales bacterium]
MKNVSNSSFRSKAVVNAAILGASGYTGHETIRLLLNHYKVNIKKLIGEKSKGKVINEIFSSLTGVDLPKIEALEDVNFKDIDVIFSCMPSGKLASIIHNLPKNVFLIDLSADFRIKDINLYEDYYGKHQNSRFLKQFTYGLTEINKSEIKKSRFISCPGCYPTSILLPMIPILNSQEVTMKDIIVDSKSGITGAGRNLRKELLFSENIGSIKAYGNGNHRHKPEIEFHITKKTSKKINIVFTPHLIPINRGILSTIYLRGNITKIYKLLKSKFNKDKFVNIYKLGNLPKISDVVGTNNCNIGLLSHNSKNYIILVSVIDNLLKGASGQAVQNMNLCLGFPEDLGLDQQPLWP